MLLTLTAGPEPVVEAARPALDAIWGKLTPHIRGAYANFLSSATDEDVAAIYPSGDHAAAGGGQGPVRPRQPVRPQPQRPAFVVPADGQAEVKKPADLLAVAPRAGPSAKASPATRTAQEPQRAAS